MMKGEIMNYGIDYFWGIGNGEVLNGGVGVRKENIIFLLDKLNE